MELIQCHKNNFFLSNNLVVSLQQTWLDPLTEQTWNKCVSPSLFGGYLLDRYDYLKKVLLLHYFKQILMPDIWSQKLRTCKKYITFIVASPPVTKGAINQIVNPSTKKSILPLHISTGFWIATPRTFKENSHILWGFPKREHECCYICYSIILMEIFNPFLSIVTLV